MKIKLAKTKSIDKNNDKKQQKSKKKLPVFYQVVIILVTFIVCLWLYILLIQWPITEEESQEAEIVFSLDVVYDDSMEMGESKVEREGQPGREKNIWKIKKKGLLTKKEIAREYDRTERLEDPVNKIERRGTRKWQYIICSDGGYRYYTDGQFADPNTGFTHSSKDFCAENGQGAMVELVDSPPIRRNNVGSNNSSSTYVLPYRSYTQDYNYYMPSQSAPPDPTAKYESPTLNQWSPSGSTDITIREGQCYVHRNGVYSCQ